MSAHDYHPSLPGFHPDQVLVDGCIECERRSKDLRLAITHMDDERFERACTRALAVERRGLDTCSATERRVYDVLAPIVARLTKQGLL